MSSPEAQRLFGTIYGADLFSTSECSRLVSEAASLDDWSRATVRVKQGERRQSDARTSEYVRLSTLGDEALHPRGLGEAIERLSAFALAVDAEHLHLGAVAIQEAQLVRYRPGHHFSWHCDGYELDFRKLSVFCYLNDLDTDGLQGGETAFSPHLLEPALRRGRVNRALRAMKLAPLVPTAWSQTPKAGRALVFPSRRVHEGRKVRSGVKYLLVVFLV